MSRLSDILGDNIIPVNKDLIITLTNENFESIDHETRKNCKIIKFAQDCNFDDILVKISKLNPKDHPNVLIFIIDTTKIEDVSSVNSLKRFLINFGENRAIFLQLTSKNENKTKFFYKEERLEIFQDAEEQQISDSGDFNNFSSFLWMYLNNSVNLETILGKNLKHLENSHLILKFVRTLELHEKFVDDLVLKCAAEGSINDLLAAVDGYIDENGIICGNELKYYLSWDFSFTSVVQTAIQHSNQTIIDFLIKKCTNLIQLLPFEHQVLISTSTFNKDKIEVLCDLLEIADFPFPGNLNSESIIKDIKLQEIIEERTKFHEHILKENKLEIRKFEEKNPKLKFAYNLKNKSALGNALDSKKFDAFCLLKSLRFSDQQIENFNWSSDAKENASGIASRQRRENVKISKGNQLSSALILATRSFIYNRNKDNDAEHEQHNKIREWFEDIYKTKYGSKLLDAAAQCEELKIIFDFECESTENADPSATSHSQGSMYPVSKWIFIGAKLTKEEKREQVIKGVIAHEICHYVMRLVYQNSEKPYYEKKKCAREKMDEVVAEIKLILFPSKREQIEVSEDHDENVKPIDDKCGGIISTVYDLYDKKDRHPELIVRPVQIQVQFDNDKEKFRELEDMYEILFAFFKLFVIPELKKFNLTKRKKVQKFNNVAGLLSKIQELNLKFLDVKDLRRLFEHQLIIVTTNAPKLFLCNIGECLREKYKELFDARNIFMASNIVTGIVENSYAYENFEDVIKKDENLNVIVDCSKALGKINKFAGTKHRFIFIVSGEELQEELSKELRSKNLNYVKRTINYNWMDLTAESKRSLLQTKVNFQNNSTFSFLDMIESQKNHDDHETFFNNIMDDKLLNLLIEKFGIVINQYSEENITDKYLSIMFQPRDFIKNSEIKESEKSSVQQVVTSEIEQDQMIENSKNLKFVLISDKAGSGKSWILKNFKNKLREAFYMYWIDYVDLKQFIREFKAQDTELEFSTFMSEKILKPKTKFEAKIFKKLYKNGKVCILFDGFDEIAPDCAEFVTKLFQSFQQNGGNQLWIATRDYFEVNLKDKLGLDAVYKLQEFTDENGVNLIASSWLFDELNDKGENINEMFGKKTFTKVTKIQNYG